MGPRIGRQHWSRPLLPRAARRLAPRGLAVGPLAFRLLVRRCALAAAIPVAGGCAAGITPLQPRPTPRDPADARVASGASAADALYFETNPLMVPVVGVSPSGIPDSFNEARDGGRTHRASDIMAPTGTPVVAAEAGSVARLSQNGLGGITIYMTDDSGRFVYYYAHLSGYAAGLAERAHVSQGDLLGYVGMTGNAPVPHLHFQVMRRDLARRDYWNGTPVDVRRFFTLTGRLREQ